MHFRAGRGEGDFEAAIVLIFIFGCHTQTFSVPMGLFTHTPQTHTYIYTEREGCGRKGEWQTEVSVECVFARICVLRHMCAFAILSVFRNQYCVSETLPVYPLSLLFAWSTQKANVIWIWIFQCLEKFARVNIQTSTHTHTYTRTDTHTRTHVHTRTHTHMMCRKIRAMLFMYHGQRRYVRKHTNTHRGRGCVSDLSSCFPQPWSVRLRKGRQNRTRTHRVNEGKQTEIENEVEGAASDGCEKAVVHEAVRVRGGWALLGVQEFY